MIDTSGEFEPTSLDELLNLLPERCRNCGYAEFVIGTAFIFSKSGASPMTMISNIQESCRGYEGAEPAEQREPEIVDTPVGPAMAFYGLNDGFDDDLCPIVRSRHDL